MKIEIMLFSMLISASAGASQPIPDQQSAYRQELDDSIRCNLATIYKLGPSGAIEIRSKPTLRSRVVARLPEGNIVYVCDQDGDWVNVFFSGTEAPCFRAYEGGLEQKRAMECQSGWVQQKLVNIISG